MKKLLITIVFCLLSCTCHAQYVLKHIHSPEDVYWLSLNVYFEGRCMKSVIDRKALAYAVLNRVKSNRFPNTIYEVVAQKHQFSWYWDGKPDIPLNKKAWEESVIIAVIALETYNEDNNINGADHYHADYVEPEWTKATEMVYVSTYGDHLFYRYDY